MQMQIEKGVGFEAWSEKQFKGANAYAWDKM